MSPDARPPSGEDRPDAEETVLFAPAEEGLAAVDPLEGYRYTLAAAADVTPRPVSTDAFVYPVDAAVAVRTDHVATVPGEVPAVYVRDADWTLVAETDPPTDRQLPPGEYYLEFCTPVKLFVRVEAPLEVTATMDGKRFDFGGTRTVEVAGFSKHDRPAATVTTTAAPRDVMAAVSTFGSALKTTSPERSFPNQRGHPPAVERGDDLEVPDGLEPPGTGVTIEVPPELRYVYPVAPLSYYLGAEVVPGDAARLVTDRGFAHDLAPDGEFEREVERVLRGTFLLDCVVRTEGLYPVTLDERETLEPALEFDPAVLYDAPLAERLATYLSVPHETLAPAMPDWKLTADLAATPDSIESLPFVVDDLAVVRTDERTAPGGAAGTADVDRSSDAAGTDDADPTATAAVDSLLRSARDGAAAATPTTVDLPPADSLERTWVGEGVLSGASKALPDAYRNRLDRPAGSGDVAVTVVCNDPEMLEESATVDAVYGPDDDAPVDVTVRQELTTAELREVLTGDADFLHYVGHIDGRGFECADGWFDARSLSTTEVDIFLLNACTSYEQGTALVEAGAVGGIVTLSTVYDTPAATLGATVARLLDAGYPLRPALAIARRACYSGGDYMVVGDGNATAVTREDCLPNLYAVERDGDAFRLEVTSYLSLLGGMGDIITPYLDGVDRYYLAAGHVDSFRVERDELATFLRQDDVPVLVDGTLHWPDELSLAVL